MQVTQMETTFGALLASNCTLNYLPLLPGWMGVHVDFNFFYLFLSQQEEINLSN